MKSSFLLNRKENAHPKTGVRPNAFNIVLRDGKVQESGTHAQLLESNGEYAKSWQLQVNEKSDEI